MNEPTASTELPHPNPLPSPPEILALRDALRRLREKRAPKGWMGFLVSLALFALVAGAGSPLDLAVLVGVLLFHELGHFIAMRALGYRDARIFFLPFFGAATQGHPSSPSVWREIVVLIAGPLPGILVGGALLAVKGRSEPAFEQSINLLVGINALNLLPVLPLDGGRLVELAVNGRPLWMSRVFAILSSAALVFLGFQGGVVTLVIAAMAGLWLWRAEVGRALASRIRGLRVWSAELLAASDDELQLLRSSLRLDGKAPAVEARSVEHLHEMLVKPCATGRTALGVLASYGATLALASAALFLGARAAPDRIASFVSTEGGYHLKLPPESASPFDDGVAAATEDGFFASVYVKPAASEGMEQLESELRNEVKKLRTLDRVLAQEPFELQGRRGYRVRRQSNDGEFEVTLLAIQDGRRALFVVARSDGSHASIARRVLESFRLDTASPREQ